MMTEASVQARRSLIFVPGVSPDMVPKAAGTGADIVCIDLEDAIAPGDKDTARTRTMAVFADDPPGPGAAADGVERIVRINGTRSADGLKDLLALLEAERPPPAIMLPKVKSPEEVRQIDELLIGPAEGIRFHVIIETNEGLDAAFEIARATPRIDSILFGAVDMAAELRTEVSWDTLLYARSRLVHAAAGAAVDLIDVPYLDLNDMDGLAREAAAAAALGFTGKGAIHPKQIAAINQAFSPSDDAVARARAVVEAFDKSESGLVVVDGVLIEKPVLRSMQRIIAVAERIAARG